MVARMELSQLLKGWELVFGVESFGAAGEEGSGARKRQRENTNQKKKTDWVELV